MAAAGFNAEVDDTVKLILGGSEVLIAEDYEVSIRYLQTPNAFSITIGSGRTAAEIMSAFPERTPFMLLIGNVLQFFGWTDGYQRSNGKATEIQIVGRDIMQALVDDCIEHDKSYANATFAELVEDQIKLAGLAPYLLTYDTAAQRKAVVGVPIVEEQTVETDIDPNELRVLAIEPVPGQDLKYTPLDYDPKYEKTVQRVTGYRSDRPIRAKAGETRYHFLEQELKRGGLFLRGGIDPKGGVQNVFVLGEPSARQGPTYRFVNQRGALGEKNVVNVLQPKLKRVATGRHATYIAQGRVGGGPDGRGQIRGVFVDEEMVALGYTKKKIINDKEMRAQAQADYIARRACAEARRSNRSLVYPIPRRHTLPWLKDARRNSVIAIDTVIDLQDDEHQIYGSFWIEGVTFRGNSREGKSTEVTLIRPEDLVFGDGEFSLPKKGKKGKKNTF